jgi:hypothetical protein
MFDSLESAQEYVGLLLEAITETAAEFDVFRQRSDSPSALSPQRCEAYRLIAYKLEQLRLHVDASHRGLTDLRALHRMIEQERAVA